MVDGNKYLTVQINTYNTIILLIKTHMATPQYTHVDLINEATPVTPSSGNTRIFVDSSKILSTVDDTGTVREYGVSTGEVIGPASSTDNAVARFDGTTGQLLQNSVLIVGDTGATSGITTLAMAGAFSGATTATASTSITSPLHVGGSGTTQTLTYQTTTGVGAAGADHIWKVGNAGATEAARILNNGNMGIGVAAPTAILHLKASTATAGTGSLKIPAGTLLTSAEAGVVENDGVNFYVSPTTTRYTVKSTQSTTAVATSAAPTWTTSATAVMMAVGWAITPANTTRVMVVVSGQMANDTINDWVTVALRYGTGTAPVNGAAVTGTLIGIAQTQTSLVGAAKSGFCISGIVSGLTLATAYWFDLSLLAITGGTATVTGVSVSLVEV